MKWKICPVFITTSLNNDLSLNIDYVSQFRIVSQYLCLYNYVT